MRAGQGNTTMRRFIGSLGLPRSLAAAAALLALAPTATLAAPPTVTAVPGTPTLPAGNSNFSEAGYVMEEFFLSGTATAYKETAPPDAAGRWSVQPDRTAPYTTRIVVIRPAERRRFNGNVVVEWLNVSGGLDVGPVWTVTRREILRSGTAYVALSAQVVGIEGGAGIGGSGGRGMGLKQVNAERYRPLNHPGDAFSYDILSQVGALVKNQQGPKVLGNLVPRKVVAVGESQSAGYLTTYTNAIDPIARVFDGFLIHSRSGGSALLNPLPRPAAGAPPAPARPTRITKMRGDIRVPVLTFLAETDVIGNGLMSGYFHARRPDTPRLRAWEVTGTAHADSYFMAGGTIDTGAASVAELAKAFVATKDLRGAILAKPINAAPQHHYVMQSALVHLLRWINGGPPPPPGARIATIGSGTATDPIKPVLDAVGNARGGVRSPWMDVPSAIHSGIGNSGAPVARLYGVTEPFDAATLARLYPGGKAEYLRKFTAALDASIASGFILRADRTEIVGLAGAMWDQQQ
jgi:hypothetical protein